MPERTPVTEPAREPWTDWLASAGRRWFAARGTAAIPVARGPEATPVLAAAHGETHSVDPRALLAIGDLELRARTVMEGVRAGLHRSPFTGFSVEFTEYRQYSPGDDLRYLDWRVLARTDRHFLKKFEEETNLRCLLLVDASRSMQFGAHAISKAEYARTLAATLAWFLHQQRDVVGVALFDDHVHDVVPPRWRAGHLRHVFAALSRAPAGRDTDIASGLRETARLCRRRGLVVIVSDFLTPPGEWSAALAELTAGGHDVRALQVLDEAEVSLTGFGRPALWEDLETGQTRYVNPGHARAGYRRRFEQHAAELRAAFDRAGVAAQLVTTDEPLDRALLRFLRAKPVRPRSRGTSRRSG